MYEAHCVSAQTADCAKVQFTDLCASAGNELEPLFKSFAASDAKLDAFYFEVLGDKSQFSALWQIVKLTLILSHGNAAVESGFSINNDMLVENLLEDSLVGQRTVYDSMLVEYCLFILTSECFNLYELHGHYGRRHYISLGLPKTVGSLQRQKKGRQHSRLRLWKPKKRNWSPRLLLQQQKSIRKSNS